jgi:ribose transport system ATP-binding protein
MSRVLRNYGLLLAVAVLSAFFAVTAPGFLSANNLTDMLRDLSILGIMTVGETLVIIGGGIDLSVGSVLVLAGILSDDLIRLLHLSPLVAVPLVLLACAAVGGLSGLVVTRGRIPSFIVTLAGLYAIRGVALSLYRHDVRSVSGALITDPGFLVLGQGQIGGLPISLLIFLLVFAAGQVLLRRTRFGLHLYAAGGNETAVKLSGIDLDRVRFMTYVLSAVCAGLAGIVLASRLQTGAPEAGLGAEFDVIGAVVIGGASLLGGYGTLTGSLIGAAFMTVLAKGQSLLGVPANYQSLARGLVILVAVALDGLGQRRRLVGRVITRSRSLRGPAPAMPASASPLPARNGGSPAGGAVVLEARGLSKSFPGVRALDDVSIALRAGEVHALVGENGAGKSTLIKILAGVYAPDAGEVYLNGEPAVIRSVHDAQTRGIAVIYQEPALVPALTVAENILLGREPVGRVPGLVDRRALTGAAQAVLDRLGSPLEPSARVRDLGISWQQVVEIAKALSLEARVVIMDEPTAALTAQETQQLFAIVRELTAHGCAVLFISHALEEVFEIADRVTVLRDGQLVASQAVSALDRPTLVRLMIGRVVDESASRARPVTGRELLRVSSLSREGVLDDVSFTLHEGEVLGVAGLVGAGRTELARALFGADPIDRGGVELDGRPVSARAPSEALAAGLALVPEDRKREGLVELLSTGQNISLGNFASITRGWIWIDPRREWRLATRMIDLLHVQPAQPGWRVRNLSGGNQQKVVLGRWLSRTPRVLLIDEPTRGVDVGARDEIYRVIDELARSGIGIVVISSYLPEVLRLSDRILVMREGRVVLELPRQDASEERLMEAATGGAAA